MRRIREATDGFGKGIWGKSLTDEEDEETDKSEVLRTFLEMKSGKSPRKNRIA